MERTALPEMTSSKWAPAFSVSLVDCWVPPFSWSRNSHPVMLRLASFFDSLFARPMTPSLSTLSAPPLSLSVATRFRFLCTTTSIGSVSIPSISTGRLEMARLMSSSVTLYWKFPTSRS